MSFLRFTVFVRGCERKEVPPQENTEYTIASGDMSGDSAAENDAPAVDTEAFSETTSSQDEPTTKSFTEDEEYVYIADGLTLKKAEGYTYKRLVENRTYIT